MPLSPGQTLNNRYRIVKLLGQGGFGAIYRAWDTSLDCPRALKENFDTSPEAQRQFKREAQILTTLTHSNLPKVIDHFIIPGQGQYLVMDYIEGEDLGTMQEKAGGPLPEGQVLNWIEQVCAALEYLHSQNPPIIHRDIKPKNIRITPQGKAMLVDFGIAKVCYPDVSTITGAKAVTPGYSPQEQYGVAKTDVRSDIYALGATLYHLLTGKQPVESVLRTMGVPLDAPGKHNPLISARTQSLVMKAMETMPEKRFQSIVELRQMLAVGSDQPVIAPVGVTGVQRTVPQISVQRHSARPLPASRPMPWDWQKALLGLGAAGALVVIVLGIVFVLLMLFRGAGDDLPAGSTYIVISETPAPALEPTHALELVQPQTPTPLAVSPTPTGLAQQITDEKGVTMLLVPAGEFTMGGNADAALAECQRSAASNECERDWFSDIEPPHQVYMDDYYIDRTEVTNASYVQCVADRACSPPKKTTSNTHSSYYGNHDFSNYPVLYIDWQQAKTYCAWRGAVLPTEAQWEKAARGADGRLYPWGSSFDGTKVNFCDKNCSLDWADKNWDDGYADAAPVGSYMAGASVYGVLDLAGNVWEWVQDWYSASYYSSQASWSNPSGPESGEFHVVRSGAWRADVSDLFTVNRSKYNPFQSNDLLGFRCARTP
jgi:formylglycine-generating enzyme required for sulfatase activity/predicted Ser/Thr protein kinase